MAPKNVKSHIDDWLDRHETISSGELARVLGVSRQAAHAHLRRGVDEGVLVPEGKGRAVRYRAALPTFRYPIATSAEDRILNDVRRRHPSVAALAGKDAEIFRYTFTEMVNNALDHSEGVTVTVRVDVRQDRVELWIDDDGLGAFEQVRRARGLSSHVEAAAELTKGKVTSLPARHSGEGIFFTSKAVDRFDLSANGVALVTDGERQDVAILTRPSHPGTRVHLVLRRPAKRALAEVFAQYTEDLAFVRTRTVVRLFGLGTDFVSRSEARRLLVGLEAFREVVVDFDRVEGIGQGFADEIFRVFALAHPHVRLVPVSMNEAVRFFVERARRAAAAEPAGSR